MEINKIIKSISLSLEEIFSKKLFLYQSGTKALEAIITNINLEKGEAVLVPTFACERIILPLIKKHSQINLVDVAPNFPTPSLNEYKKAYTGNCKAILLVYLFGYVPSDLEEIIQWAKEKQLIIIEDIASSFGLHFKGKLLGTLGDYTFGSFGYDKFISINSLGFGSVENTKSLKFGKVKSIINYNSFVKSIRRKNLKLLNFIFLPFLPLIDSISPDKPLNSKSLVNLQKKINNWRDEIKTRKVKYDKYIKRINRNKLVIFEANNDEKVVSRIICRFDCNNDITKKYFKIFQDESMWIGRDYNYPIHKLLNREDFKNAGDLSNKVFNFVTNPRIDEERVIEQFNTIVNKPI